MLNKLIGVSLRFVVLGTVLVGSIAAADPAESGPSWKRPNNNGAFLEVSGGWMRVDPAGKTYRAEYVRIAPQVSLNRWVYVGAAFQIGRISGSSGTLNGTPAIGLVETDPQAKSTGSIIEPQVIVGVRDRIGIVSGAFEVAPTVRWTTATTDPLTPSYMASQTTIELHARADVWPTPRISAGIMVGADFNSLRDLQTGLQIGFHFEPYDLMR